MIDSSGSHGESASGPPALLSQEDEVLQGDSAGKLGLAPLDPSLLNADTANTFPIYFYDDYLSCFVLVKGAERAATVRNLQRAREDGHRRVYVPRHLVKSITTFAANNLQVLANQAIPSSRQVYGIAKALLSSAFSEEWDMDRLDACSRSVGDAISDLIDSGGDAIRHMILAQSRDPALYTHSLNVCVLGTALASYLHLCDSKEERRSLAQGFLLHDVGKLDVPHEILVKPGKLTKREFERVKIHPARGYGRVKRIKTISENGRRVILEHHEDCDGRGYPRGLTRDQISKGARICAIVESYEDLTSHRPYHKPLSVFQTLGRMREEGIGKYDIDLFKAFISFFRTLSTSSIR